MPKAIANKMVELLLKEQTSVKAKDATEELWTYIQDLRKAVSMALECLHSHTEVLKPMLAAVEELKLEARNVIETHKLEKAAAEFMGSGDPASFAKVWSECDTFQSRITGALTSTADFCVSTLCDCGMSCAESGDLDREQWQLLLKLATEINEALS